MTMKRSHHQTLEVTKYLPLVLRIWNMTSGAAYDREKMTALWSQIIFSDDKEHAVWSLLSN